MSSIEDLREALKRVEEHLDFARLIYRSLPFVFWAGFIPLLYIAASLATSSIGQTALGISIGISLSLWFLLEERSAYKVLEKLNTALGRNVENPKLYIALQLASWPIAAFIAYISICVFGLIESAWPLVFFSSGIGLLIFIDKAFRGTYDKEMLTVFGLPLISILVINHVPLPKEDFTIMIISSSMALTGFLYIRRAFRT